MKIFFLCITFLIFYKTSKGQGIYVPLQSPTMHIIDRMEIKQGKLGDPLQFNTTTQSYKRENIVHYIDSLKVDSIDLSEQDKFNLTYLQADNFEFTNSANTKTKGLWGTGIYKQKGAFGNIDVPDFKILINPIVYLRAGYDTELGETTILNTRGAEIRGTLGKRVGFYTMIADEIQTLTTWDRQYYAEYEVMPGQTFVHRENYPTLNYWLASGYLSVTASKYLDFQFGHGRNFLGNGYRSLMLSDFAPDNLFLRMNTRIWKINYTNIWGELHNYVPYVNRNLSKRHYYAATHASVNVTKKLNIGLFQTIVFQRDSGHSINGFDPQYLNPIIFYLLIEMSVNSPDKVILGGDFKYNFAKYFSIYGQGMISELVVSELTNNRGWWGNKLAYQLGIKYIDVLNINNLDLQLEINEASPYMYTSFDAKNAYASFNQNMAHPIGANFREYISIVKYQPTNKLFLSTRFIYNTYGADTNDSNWGKNIQLSYNNRVREYGNVLGQGVKTNLLIVDFMASYMFWHNMFIDLQLTYRDIQSATGQFDSNTIHPSIGIRMNINARQCNY